MSETKLNKSLCSVEFRLKHYMAICKDQTLHGIIIAVWRGLIADEILITHIKEKGGVRG